MQVLAESALFLLGDVEHGSFKPAAFVHLHEQLVVRGEEFGRAFIHSLLQLLLRPPLLRDVSGHSEHLVADA